MATMNTITVPTSLHCPLTDFGTVTVLALSPWGAGEVVTLDSPSHAGTALGAVTGDPGLAYLQKPWEAKGVRTERAFQGSGLTSCLSSLSDHMLYV